MLSDGDSPATRARRCEENIARLDAARAAELERHRREMDRLWRCQAYWAEEEVRAHLDLQDWARGGAAVSHAPVQFARTAGRDWVAHEVSCRYAADLFDLPAETLAGRVLCGHCAGRPGVRDAWEREKSSREMHGSEETGEGD